MLTKDIERKIIERITSSEKVQKIILFGSHASGSAGRDSDIDLIVVLDSDEQPKTYKERMDNYLRVSRALREIKREYPIDLIVYTNPEFRRFTELGSMFSRNVLKHGREIK